GDIPRAEVGAAVSELFDKFKVARMYIDPRHWESQADDWAFEYGDDRVIQWPTNSVPRMYPALNRYLIDLIGGATTHDGCVMTRTHALNARKVDKPGDQFILGKPSEHQKIEALRAEVLDHEAAADSRGAGR